MPRRPDVDITAALLLCGALLLGVLRAAPAAAWDGANPGALPPALRATAGAGAATSTGVGSLFANPAVMGLQPGQSIELGFARGQRPGRTTFSLGSVDGNRGGIAGGTSYAYEFGQLASGRERSGYDWRAGIATGLRGETAALLLGGTIRRMSLELGAHQGEAKREIAGWTGDAGLLLALGQYVRLGAMWQNIRSIDESETPSRLVGGLGIAAGPVLIAADGRFRTEDWSKSWAVGAQFGIANVAILRAGWQMDERGLFRHLITGGAGIRVDTYGFDVSFEMDPQTPARWRLGLAVVLGLPYVAGN
ncbi:MAG: hypothetical protein H6747_06435 [Deltaproteobacteria bacterium]|nr:hypothetical protein [Deltaproteobacteria bacterium]